MRYRISGGWLLMPALLAAILVGCGNSKEVAGTAPGAVNALAVEPLTKPVASNGKMHPMAKHIEISGYRLSEVKPGTLRIRMNVVNHSRADLGEVPMKVRINAAGAKPEDPPVAEVSFRVQLGPEESKQVEPTYASKLRVYELPDWQYLRCTVEIVTAAAVAND
jgi:hypothetical protein